MPDPVATAPRVEPGRVTFSVPDPDAQLAGVRLLQDLERPRDGPAFEPVPGGDGWRLEWHIPDVDRFEYKLELEHVDGRREVVLDPANPRCAPGAFGEKSVVELPGYRPPAWLAVDAPAGATATTAIPSRVLRAELPLLLWASANSDPAEPLPLLVANDGPEYAAYSSLTAYLDAMVATGRLPAMRAALIAPVQRSELYSAGASYPRALAHDVLPAIEDLVPTLPARTARVGMGASLGALAMLHAQRARPDLFGGLFLQAGAYFRRRFDPQEAGFPHFGRITRFVGTVLGARGPFVPVPVAMTCGTAEENLRNNRAVHEALAVQRYPVAFHEVRDAHNWIAWRDAFDPALTDLLGGLFG